MRLYHAEPDHAKGWYTGAWDAGLAVNIGYAHVGVDEPHYHQRMTEIYCVARGNADLRVEQHTVKLSPGDCVVVEPGEAHTFLRSSADYLHFVVHAPGLTGDEARADKAHVPRVRLGL
jgi:mannose-6-phosphate isomerase-like protein (cupin superfamily)